MLSICRAHSEKALLNSNNSTRHIFIRWVKRGFMRPLAEPTHTQTCWTGQRHWYIEKFWLAKTQGPLLLWNAHPAHKFIQAHKHWRLNAGVIWGMLNIYLSCLPGWLHQSSLSLSRCPLTSHVKIPQCLVRLLWNKIQPSTVSLFLLPAKTMWLVLFSPCVHVPSDSQLHWELPQRLFWALWQVCLRLQTNIVTAVESLMCKIQSQTFTGM